MSFSFLKGSNLPFSKFSVTSRKFVVFNLVFMVILNLSSFCKLVTIVEGDSKAFFSFATTPK